MKRTVISWLLLFAMLCSLLPMAVFADEPETASPEPTAEAAPAPSAEPTPEQTAEAAPAPSAESTLEQTAEAAPVPSAEPTPAPTDEPTASPEPAVSPEPTEPGMAAFETDVSDVKLPFEDVKPKAWYYDAVCTMYALELVSGMSDTVFSPASALTAAQCAVLSVRVYERYHGMAADHTRREGEAWHAPWMRAAVSYGICPADWKGGRILTRSEALHLLYRTLPKSELEPVRTCARIPGVTELDKQYDELHCLYDAGILNGVDAYGKLDGAASVTRAQYLTLLARLIAPDQRLTEPLPVQTGMAAFRPGDCGNTQPFRDVAKGSWYHDSVAMLYQMGLLSGTGAGLFSPGGTVKLRDAVILAVRVYEVYHGLTASIRLKDTETFLALGREYGILPENWKNLSGDATRKQTAILLGQTLPEKELQPLRNISAIPDLAADDPWYDLLYRLFCAGILNGADWNHTFRGGETIRRSELAAMFARLTDPSRRIARDMSLPAQVIRQAVAGYKGTWSVYLRDVASGETVVFNNRRAWSASVIKLYIMGTVLDAIERGTLKNSSYIQSNLRDMITWSSNSAWHNLAVTLGNGSYSAGMRRVNDWAGKNGYPDSGLLPGEPRSTTSAADAGLFLLRVLEGTNVSAAASSQMLSLLKAQKVLHKIPAGVPKGVPTANKTGELDFVENDAAIIYAPFGTYILVVITENGSIRNVKDLSSRVYSAMERSAN